MSTRLIITLDQGPQFASHATRSKALYLRNGQANITDLAPDEAQECRFSQTERKASKNRWKGKSVVVSSLFPHLSLTLASDATPRWAKLFMRQKSLRQLLKKSRKNELRKHIFLLISNSTRFSTILKTNWSKSGTKTLRARTNTAFAIYHRPKLSNLRKNVTIRE